MQKLSYNKKTHKWVYLLDLFNVLAQIRKASFSTTNFFSEKKIGITFLPTMVAPVVLISHSDYLKD